MNTRSNTAGGLVILAVAAAFPGSASPAFPQETGTIRGVVISSITQEPLEGVVVRVGDGGQETRTGVDGGFVLWGVSPGKTGLTFELLPDFITTTEAVEVVGGQTIRMSLALVPLAVFLDEILVEGKPSSVEGVVRRYGEGETLALAGKGTVVDLLAQGFPGVEVRRGSGQVGSGARILIRGVNSVSIPGDPLVYLDGIRVDDPSEIASSALTSVVGILEAVPAATVDRIEVLKGPAATRYGIASSSGVILIWTRRGGIPSSPAGSPEYLPDSH